MSEYRRLRIAVFDQDRSALHGLVAQIKCDCRVLYCVGFISPHALARAAVVESFDIIIVDSNASFGQHLDNYLHSLPINRKQTRLICLTNTTASDVIGNAIQGAAHAVLHKQDVVPGLVHAAIRARGGYFLYSESLRQFMPEQSLHRGFHFEMVVRWRPNPHLSDRENEVMYACRIEGEDNAAVAQRLSISEDAIEKALLRAYQKIRNDDWYSRIGIDEEMLEQLPASKRAYLLYTGLARSFDPDRVTGTQKRPDVTADNLDILPIQFWQQPAGHRRAKSKPADNPRSESRLDKAPSP